VRIGWLFHKYISKKYFESLWNKKRNAHGKAVNMIKTTTMWHFIQGYFEGTICYFLVGVE
jgi:hypothetical protein